MKRTTQLFTLTTAILATIIITMIVSPAQATKRYTIEAGDIAFVDVFKLIDKALIAEEKAAVRDVFNTKSNELVTGLQAQLASLETSLSTMQQNDPAAANAYADYQTATGQLQTATQQINNAYQTLIAQQLASAYTEIYAAANEIGSQEGYAFVFATRTDGELIQTDTITGVTQEILARPLMTPPGGVDITELVRVKLGYPEKAPEPVAAPATDPATPVTEFTDTPAKTDVND
ncbi:MAG: OmpH family outer membrane protein [Phycisphaerales bacterium]|nr:OmpH family outer membrane protein [Phycisphaerales bacterium]